MEATRSQARGPASCWKPMGSSSAGPGRGGDKQGTSEQHLRRPWLSGARRSWRCYARTCWEIFSWLWGSRPGWQHVPLPWRKDSHKSCFHTHTGSAGWCRPVTAPVQPQTWVSFPSFIFTFLLEPVSLSTPLWKKTGEKGNCLSSKEKGVHHPDS